MLTIHKFNFKGKKEVTSGRKLFPAVDLDKAQ